ncbi:hypothetical protein K491DRAFT_684095 [Lophiostoma macrostomum CBS 122681]|uniref:Uncharacterized protein n=1 Tax=Lophiostoma macrostomum CBS 122681 TaxID=1314788 RepID=A0A6A6SMK3_9PLEO|nr:hypothetical protein K491DRAFT_684095 [Lophiostoma macrostomum CBS 122681]
MSPSINNNIQHYHAIPPSPFKQHTPKASLQGPVSPHIMCAASPYRALTRMSGAEPVLTVDGVSHAPGYAGALGSICIMVVGLDVAVAGGLGKCCVMVFQVV